VLRLALPRPRAEWLGAHFDETLDNIENMLQNLVELPACLAGDRERANIQAGERP
jgi:hypothetical protein